MTRTVDPKRIRDLLTLLGRLEQLHDGLAASVKAKVDAIRRADMQALQQREEQERKSVEQIQQAEGLRRQLMDVIGEQLGLPPRAARAMSVSQLVLRVPKEQRQAILDATQSLRAAVSRVSEANRVAGIVARELADHLNRVFTAVRPSRERGTGYTGEGVPVARKENRIFEAVG